LDVTHAHHRQRPAIFPAAIAVNWMRTYLKVVGDSCRWANRIVLGCDDTAKSEFINARGRNLHMLTCMAKTRTSPHICPTAIDTLGLQMAQPA
jgi:hypothetical protein